MKQRIVILTVFLANVAGAAEFGDLQIKGHDIYVGEDDFHMLYETDRSLRTPGDVHGATDVYVGRDVIVVRDATMGRTLSITGEIHAATKVIKVVVTPQATQTPSPTNTAPTSTPTSTYTGVWTPLPTGTQTPTPTITNTFTPVPTIELVWLKGDGDLQTMDIYADHIIIPGIDPTPAGGEVMWSIRANQTPVFEVNAEGDVLAHDVRINAATMTGDLIHDDGSGASPKGIYRDGGGEAVEIYKEYQGPGVLDHDDSEEGWKVADNLGVGPNPTPKWVDSDSGDGTFQDDIEAGTNIHAGGYLQIHATHTPLIPLGAGDISAADDLAANDELIVGGTQTLRGNLVMDTADRKVTQPEDSSGTGPLHWEFCGLTTNHYSANYDTLTYSLEPTSTPSDIIYIGLPIPAGLLGGAVIIDAITVYGDDDDSDAYVDDISLFQNDGDETLTGVAQYATDIGVGTVGLWNQQILSSDVSRATYPGPLHLAISCASLGTEGDITICKIVVQAHLE